MQWVEEYDIKNAKTEITNMLKSGYKVVTLTSSGNKVFVIYDTQGQL